MSDSEVVSVFLMLLGFGETVVGLYLRQQGINMPEADRDAVASRKRRARIKAGTFVAASGVVLVGIGIAVQVLGLP
ncbi:MAG: hypothetical protein JNM76_17505 [Betaproteobacteria bacterium]|nr:hypothetical protein [Betaproteobacteria bacterium]